MAEKGLKIDQETFCCSICLDLLKDPVTIPCGHSYCMGCVNTHWNGEVSKQSYSCPQCRQNFTQRPVLVKNTMLAALMERLKKSGPPVAPVSHCYAAHGDVCCDLCSGRKLKAVKSCLQCLVSYCKDHLQPHYDVAALKKHKLVEPTENLQDNICSQHDEVMKMFCRTDQQCICYLCSVDEHKGHDTVTAAAERTEKQRELEDFQMKILQRIDNKQKDVVNLQQQVNNISRTADTAVEHSHRSLKELICLIEKRMTEVKQQVRSQQEAEEHRVKELQDKLQQEITELKRKHTELDKLSHTEDHIQFLHKTEPFSKAVVASNEKLTGADDRSANALLKPAASGPPPLPPFEPPNVLSFQTIGDLKKYASRLTFDPLSLNNKLELSKGNTLAKRLSHSQAYHHHPARFTDFSQVVSKETLTGRCFWEVSGKYEDGFAVAVAYKDIRRNGPFCECDFGHNTKSWALECYNDCYVLWHDTFGKRIPSEPPYPGQRRVGIFLDHKAGILSFYEIISDVVNLIDTVETTFTQPLVAGVVLEDINSTAELCS